MWQLIHVSGLKMHFVSQELADATQHDLLSRRDDDLISAEPFDRGFIDLPGVVRQDRTYHTFDVPDCGPLDIPHTDVVYLMSKLHDAPIRHFGSDPYYKIHGWLHCVVFTPEQRRAVLDQYHSLENELHATSLQEQFALQNALQPARDAGYLIAPQPIDPTESN